MSTRWGAVLVLAAVGCSETPARMFPASATVSTSLEDEAPDILTAIDLWNASFACRHSIKALVAHGDVDFDPKAITAGRFSHTEGKIYLGAEAIERHAVIAITLHELGHAHFAKHVPGNESLYSVEIDPSNTTIDVAMINAVCTADAGCCL